MGRVVKVYKRKNQKTKYIRPHPQAILQFSDFPEEGDFRERLKHAKKINEGMSVYKTEASGR